MSQDKDPEHTPETAPRRNFLKFISIATAAPLAPQALAGAGLTAFAGAALAADAAPATAATGTPIPLGYNSFSADEAAFVETMVNVMCPADQYTPSGVDCGLAIFMDRQLAGAFGQGAGRYMSGPWQPGKPQAGLQLPMTPEQFFKAGIEAANVGCKAKFAKTFDMLTPVEADGFLKDISTGQFRNGDIPLQSWFQDLMYPLFSQACFADPIYGGNHDKVFWKMIGYPGLPATHTLDMVQYRGKEFPGAKDPKSIADFS